MSIDRSTTEAIALRQVYQTVVDRTPIAANLDDPCQSWEPSWEPPAVEWCGLLWTPVEPRAFRFGLCGRLWTPMDTAWRSTDQEVGDSSSAVVAIAGLLLSFGAGHASRYIPGLRAILGTSPKESKRRSPSEVSP